jgi:tRNA(fMet)-specific endonuclease VapC
MPAVRYLLDTNIVTAVVKQPGGTLARRLAAMPRSEFGVSIVVACELRYGAARKGSARLNSQLEAVLEGIDVFPLEQQADRHYGEIRRALERIGRPIGSNDLLIAAHARYLEATLVTHNTNEFSRVPGLVVEDWLADE